MDQSATDGPRLYKLSLSNVFSRDYRSAIVALFSPLAFLQALGGGNLASRLGALALGLWGLAMLTYLVNKALRTVALYPDRLELRELWGPRELKRAEIAGYRVRKAQQDPSIGVEMRGSRWVMTLPLWENRDALEQWFDGLVDLDQAELAESERELMNDSSLGASESERRAQLDRIKIRFRVLNVAALALAAAVFFWPYPPFWLVAAAAVAPVASLVVVWLGRGVATLQYGKTTAKPTASAPFLCGLALATRAFMDTDFLDGQAILIPALALAAVATVLALTIDPRTARTFQGRAILFGVIAIYAWGVVAEADEWLDPAPDQTFQAVVTDKWKSRKSAVYHLDLTAWGPYGPGRSFQTSSDIYEQSDIGDLVCPRLHGGAVGARWYEITPCR